MIIIISIILFAGLVIVAGIYWGKQNIIRDAIKK
jgi:hypothetical protein